MNIAVYCGSSFGNDPAITQAAACLGTWIGESGHTLIYGGGDSGLMGTIARSAHERGTKVIGVLPGNVEFICSRPQPYCSEVIIMPDMNSRKQKMLELADAFVALPGGIGTMDEITEAITLTKIGVFKKPAVLVNTNNFYFFFQAMLTKMEENGFLEKGSMKQVLFSDNIDEIARFLNQ